MAGRFLFRVLFLCLALFCVSKAWATLGSQFRNASLFEVATLVEKGKPLDPGFVSALSARVRSSTASAPCDEQVVRAAVSISLFDLSRQNPTVDFDAWSASLGETRQLMRHALTCLPNDGNLWIRLALIERAAVFVPDKILPLVAMSVRLSPSEIGVIMARFEIWRIAGDWLSPEVSGDAVRDVRVVMEKAKPADAAKLVGDTRSVLGQEVRRQVAELPALRIHALDKAGVFKMGPPMKPAAVPLLDLLSSPRR